MSDETKLLNDRARRKGRQSNVIAKIKTNNKTQQAVKEGRAWAVQSVK